MHDSLPTRYDLDTDGGLLLINELPMMNEAPPSLQPSLLPYVLLHTLNSVNCNNGSRD